MADELVAPAAPAPIATPAPAAPAAAEVAPVAAPAAPAAVAVEAAPTPTPAPAAAAPAADAPTSILSEAQPPAPVTAPPPVTPAEVAAPAVPPPPPVYEAFRLPEGVTLDEGKVTEFTKMLGDLEVTGKATHAEVQAFGQKAVDFFIAEQQRSQRALVDSFNETRKEWRAAIKADPIYGGDNYVKSTQSAGALIEQYGGTPDQVKELRNVLYITGAGDHPALIRLFANAGKHLAQEGKPVAAVNPRSPALVSKSARRYQNSQPNGSGS